MAYKPAHKCTVKLGANNIVGMGTYSLSGIASDQLESTSFGDEWKTYEFGLKDGGTVSFNGHYDPADSTGQQALISANVEATDLTTLRFYVDDTSYFEACQTTGYLSPTTTTGASTEESLLNITSIDIGADKSGLMTISFQAKVSGALVLV